MGRHKIYTNEKEKRHAHYLRRKARLGIVTHKKQPKQAEQPIIKVCPICKKEFTVSLYARKYCSSECRKMENIRKQKEKRPVVFHKKGVCFLCGSEFSYIVPREYERPYIRALRMFCNEKCQDLWLNRSRRLEAMAKTLDKGHTKTRLVCPSCGLILKERLFYCPKCKTETGLSIKLELKEVPL